MVATPRSSGVRGTRVLIIEDNPDGRESLRLLLSLLGFEVDVAADGREGLRKALDGHPEVAIIDLGLPGLDGFEVARRVRAALGRRVVLLAYSAYARDDAPCRVREAGFDAHLVKPATLEEFMPWLRKVGCL